MAVGWWWWWWWCQTVVEVVAAVVAEGHSLSTATTTTTTTGGCLIHFVWHDWKREMDAAGGDEVAATASVGWLSGKAGVAYQEKKNTRKVRTLGGVCVGG